MHYTVTHYLLERLAQIGIRHLFGVPGDYNLLFLEHVIEHQEITWVGCANELNAAYAADGYARCQPAGALLTTYGVGELSAANGIAGSYAEYLPVIHIVGTPTTLIQKNGELVHHSLGDGDFGHFSRMYQEITVAQAHLTLHNAPMEIDRVLAAALYHRRPVYINLPSDVAVMPVSQPSAPLLVPEAPYSPESLASFLSSARALLSEAKSVSLLADFLVDRFSAKEEIQKLANCGYLPHATLVLGKGVLDESHPQFVGTYSGGGSETGTKFAIESADVILTLGVRLTDTSTCGFTHYLETERRIDVQPFEARIGHVVYTQIPMIKAIQGLTDLVNEYGKGWKVAEPSRITLESGQEEILDQPSFWHHIQHYIQPDDVIIADQGTSSFGGTDLRLPRGAIFLTQSLWGSIGYTLPAAFGVQTALPERRVIVLIGDGSAQLTVQEMGSMLRDGLKPIIILLNNGGYTVERAIHGPDARYNDIAHWDWTKLPKALGLNLPSLSVQVSSPQALVSALALSNTSETLVFIEAMLPKQDIPRLLASICASLKERSGE